MGAVSMRDSLQLWISYILCTILTLAVGQSMAELWSDFGLEDPAELVDLLLNFTITIFVNLRLSFVSN